MPPNRIQARGQRKISDRVDERRERVAALNTAGWSQQKIAKELKTTQATVSRDLEVHRERLRERGMLDTKEAIDLKRGQAEDLIMAVIHVHYPRATESQSGRVDYRSARLVLDGAKLLASLYGLSGEGKGIAKEPPSDPFKALFQRAQKVIDSEDKANA